MEKFEPQPQPDPEQPADTSFDWIAQANRESLQALSDLRVEAGLPPLDIDDLIGEFWD